MNLQKSLKDFATLPFKNAAVALFQSLGYHSTINQIDQDFLNTLKFTEVREPHFLFQLTDDEIQAHSATFRSSESAVNNSIIQSYLFFAFELNEVQYSRTTLANLVREVNKQFATPALILFKYNELLTLAIIHRRLNKKDSEQDVLEKVTLIKDIKFAEPHRAHLDILSSLTFANISPRPNNFVELHQAWQKILDISVLNKKFYSELAVLFTELVGGTRGKEIFKTTLKLPSVNGDQVLKEFAVRLIGRLLFCWFLQKKTSAAGISLIPKQILSIESLNELAENAENVDFYHVRLEPLFFETLNKPVEQRKPEFQTGDWAHVPFLNGGLFEPHLHDFYDNSCTLNTLSVPDEWLKKLLSFFERYHFTIEENTPLDVQVAIEPEMLGQIFENLLAEINPETGESARKATGSYYTPREIVDYMVDESLLAYFETQLVDLDKHQLRVLFAHGEVSNPFNPSDSSSLLAAIGNIKILDPACGSGAFPMGILQKLTLLLQKLDPDCVIWLNNLLNKIPDATARTFMRQKLEGEKVLWNYTRKLGILRECIYGVDIQPIAIGISRLRCFLSLIVDEKIEDNQANRGIIPLPNLDFKFVCANTLKGISHLNLQLYESKARLQINELAELRGRYLNSQGDEKVDLQAKFQAVQNALLNIVLSWAGKDSELSQLATWKPFSDESCDWFEPFWMFGMEEGFDVVIGNPPYGANYPKELKKYFQDNYESAKTIKNQLKGSLDTFSLFIDMGLRLCSRNAVLSYIVPMAITSSESMTALHKMIFRLCETIYVSSFSDRPKKIFDNVEYPVSILIALKRGKPLSRIFTTKVNKRYKDSTIGSVIRNLEFVESSTFVKGGSGRLPKIGTSIEISILAKLMDFKITLKDLIGNGDSPIFYKTAGGRYYKIITSRSTGSTQEKIFYVNAKYRNLVVAILSSNLYFWFYHVHSDNLHIKSYELETFPIPIDLFSEDDIRHIDELCELYMTDLWKNSKVKQANYTTISEYREFYARLSKPLIDKIDLAIQKPYGLSDDEINFIINYDLKFRTDDKE